jgi:exosortase A
VTNDMAVLNSAAPAIAEVTHLQPRESLASFWARPLVGLVAAEILTLWFFRQTALSMLVIWSNSRTYSYCFVILPVVGILIWNRRRDLLHEEPAISVFGFVLLFFSALMWLAGNIADVQLVQHVALIAMLDSLVLAFLGAKVTRLLLFPLGFLFFAVPLGDSLVPLLQKWTAALTVGALRLSGIPAIQDGYDLSTPSGNWQVAEACSGIRYLIASIVIGFLMAGAAYRSWNRRIVFLLFSALLPLVANVLRAYGIAALAYYSGNALATGVDHIVYGFLFFSLITAILLSVALRWFEPRPPSVDRPETSRVKPIESGKIVLALVAVIMVPGSAARLGAFLWSTSPTVPSTQALVVPLGWELTDNFDEEWAPEPVPFKTRTIESFTSDSRDVSVCFITFSGNRRGVVLVNPSNLTGSSGAWTVLASNARTISTRTGSLRLSEYVIAHGRQRRLVWLWYSIGDWQTASVYQLRGIQAKDRLFGQPREVTLTALSAPFQAEISEADLALSDFVK